MGDTEGCARLAVALLACATMPCAGASAQEAAPPAPAATPSAAAAQSGLPAARSSTASDQDEIVITALRRQQRLEDVPATIIAVSGNDLATAGVRRFQDLSVIAPGVQISRSGSYTQPAIRGISTTFAGGGQETNVAIYVDGFYTSDQLSSNQDFANIQDVQILKGPQGTLYGRNATGGAILITTRSPGDHLEADGTAAYAWRFDDKRFNAFIGGPIAQGIKASVAGYYRRTDGYFTDINNFAPNVPLDSTTYTFGHGFKPVNEAATFKRDGNDSGFFKNWSIRPKVILEPFSDVKITLGYVHTEVNDPRAFAYQIKGQALNPAATYNGYPVANARDKTSLNFQPQNDSKANEYNATIDLGLGELGKLTSRSAYRTQRDFQTYDLDGTPRDPGTNPLGTAYSSIQENKRKTFTQQLDYAGDFGRLNLLGGFFYYDDKFTTPDGYEDIGIASNPTATRLDFDTRAYAFYLDGTLQFGDSFFITAGGRYAHDQKKLGRSRYTQTGLFVPSESTVCYSDSANPIYLVPPGTPASADPPAVCNGSLFKHVSRNAFTPHVVLRYNLSQGTNVYASVSRGFKAPTINTASNFNSLKPEKVTAYEAGIKTAHRGLLGELAGFYYDYKDNQISAIDPNTPSITTKIQNSGGARVYGLDATLSYRFPETPLNLRASFEYLHARYTNYDNATNVIISPANLNTSVIGSWTGRRLVRAPDFSGSFGGDYTVALFGGKLVASGTGTFSSRYAPQNASYQCSRVSHDAAGADIPFVIGTQGYCAAGTNHKQHGRFEENGYFQANAQLAWTDPSDHFTLTLFADNLTGDRYKIISSAFAYESYDSYSEPRTIGVSVGFRF